MAETTENKNTTDTTTTENKSTDTAGAGAGTSTETPKAKTEEEIRAELQKEYEKMADKRVTDAIKKKEKEWADKAAKEKMTEDERKRVEEQERLQAQAKKDFDLTIKGLRLDVVDAIAELGLDAGFRNLIAVEDLATISDEDERKKKLTERIKGMKSLFDAEVAKQVAKAKAEFLKGSTPETGSKKKDVTKYDEAKKAGNVSGMISEKMNAYRNREE
nr:MAG TPA: Major head protein [Caudoviricetes sp.]